jgi:uncharacterized iron-regulated membrane protein
MSQMRWYKWRSSLSCADASFAALSAAYIWLTRRALSGGFPALAEVAEPADRRALLMR